MEIVDDKSEGQETQPEKIFDADNNKWIDNPMLKKTEEKSEEQEEEDEKEEETEKSDGESEEKSEESDDKESEESEKEEAEEESEEDDKDEESDDEKKKSEDDGLTPDAYVEATYGEKYGIKTEAELSTLVENALSTMDEFEELKKENTTLKAESGKPKFTSDKQAKAFEFLSQFDIDRQGEALDTYAKLLTMDLDKADGRAIAQEAFVHQHPELSRADAEKKFNRDWEKKYNLNREKFEGSDAEFENEKEMVEIDKKADVATAKKYLAEQKTKYKPAEKEQPKENPVVVDAIKKNAKEYAEHFQSVDQVTFGEGDDKYVFKIDADKKKLLLQGVEQWVKNPKAYNDKGELVGVNSPDHMKMTLVGGLFLKEIVKALQSQVKNSVTTKRVEELGEKKTNKKGGSGKGDTQNVNKDTLGEQARMLIKKNKAA